MGLHLSAPLPRELALKAFIVSRNGASLTIPLLTSTVLTDVADLPYDLVKPVLAKLQTPKQLVSRYHTPTLPTQTNQLSVTNRDQLAANLRIR